MEYDSFSYNSRDILLCDALTPNGEDLHPRFNKDNLFCPECETARLKFTIATRRRRAFLSTKQPSQVDSNTHAQDCSHAYTLATKNQIREHYDDLEADQLRDKLCAAINRLLRRGRREEQNPQAGENPLIITPRVEGGQQVSRRLPTKSFYRLKTITEENYNVPILCYGDVYLRVEPRQSAGGGTYYYLWVIDGNSRDKIRFFYRGGHRDNVNENTLYHVALIAVFEASPNAAQGYISNLFSQDSLYFIPV